MDTKDFYDHSYQVSEDPFSPNESIADFLEISLPVLSDYPPAQSFLELGCGQGTHFGGREEVWGVDFSKTAIDNAKRDSRFKNVKFVCQNVVDMDLSKKFDLILDSHLLHCLINEDDRKKYLKNVLYHLSPGGLFYIETMVMHKQCEFHEGPEYSFEMPILFRNGTPCRFVDIAENIEKELIDTGFKIIYFYINSGKRIIPVRSRVDSLFTDPCVLRIITTCPSN